jgi:hypothetical protein
MKYCKVRSMKKLLRKFNDEDLLVYDPENDRLTVTQPSFQLKGHIDLGSETALQYSVRPSGLSIPDPKDQG